jgi:hypothetical protein
MTSKIKVDNITNQSDSNIVNKCGTTITLGASGDTINLASGASQTGFGRTGTVDWDTTAKTASFTAVSGNGYFVNTTSGALTVTLPASPSAGDIVAVADYAGTAATNSITIARNGSNFEGGTSNGGISTNRQTGTFVYIDGTQGWVVVNSNDASFIGPGFVTATGGTVTCCGDYKIHTFTAPGTFTVTNAGTAGGSNTVSYMVVAGGGGGKSGPGYGGTGGGGAGGFREGKASSDCYTASPLNAPTGLPVSVQGYPITVGGGGAVSAGGSAGNNGSNSIFSTITSTGGGTGGAGTPAGTGGSGGGGNENNSGAAGNTPPVSPPQGNSGGNGSPPAGGGGAGGGGATVAGSNACGAFGGDGGAGATSSINGTPTARGGGGGGGAQSGPVDTSPDPASGGSGGGGNGGAGPGPDPGQSAGTSGTANTGGGGGSSRNPIAGSGGSGIVIIRYKFQ